MIPQSIRRSLLNLVIISSQGLAADWLALYNSGEEKLRQGMAEEAARDLRQSLRRAESEQVRPAQLAGILDALGRSRFRAGKYREATGYFEKALQLANQPESRLAGLVNTAQAYRELGEYKQSEHYIREALRIAPGDARHWQLLGSVLIKSRKYEDAQLAEQKALALGDTSVAALAWSDLSAMAEAQGHLTEAATLLQRAINTMSPQHARGRLLVSLAALDMKTKHAHQAAGHLREAIQELEAALGTMHPDLAKALDFYASVLRQVGRKSEARQASERAGEIRASLAATVHWRDLKPPVQD